MVLPLLQPAAPPLLIQHVNVVDCASDGVRLDQDVLIENGRIKLVAKSGRIHPSSAQRISANGKFLIPGLWDMHVHGTEVPGFLGLYLYNGVTGVRDMFDPTGETFKLRNQIANGALQGPHMVCAGRIVDGPKPYWPGSIAVSNPPSGRKAVVTALEEGSDFIKVYSGLQHDAFLAIAEACKKRHVVFAGHVPEDVTAAEASDAGQKSFEHLYGIMKACSNAPTAHTRLIGLSPAETAKMIKSLLSTYDNAKANLLFAKLKKNHSWQCPTFTVLYVVTHPKADFSQWTSRLDVMPSWAAGFWKATIETRSKDWTADNETAAAAYFDKELQVLGDMYRAGVPILAGTDTLNPYCFPGFSLHDELAWLVKAGMKPIDALRAATINPAIYLERQEDYGTIEQGKVADLVLLTANPLADIHNTAKVDSVILKGKLLGHAALQSLLPKKAAWNRSRPPVSYGGIDDDF